MKFTGVRDAAAQYIKRGFRPVPLYGLIKGTCSCGGPCKERDWGKHEPPTTDGQWKDGRTFTPDEFSDAQNIALAMGPWTGDTAWLVALDLDGTDDVGNFFRGMPPTLTQRTPRGMHLVYTVRHHEPLGNWVDVFQTKNAGFQCDLRYARGRIVVAPSMNGAGHYEWTHWRTPAALPPGALRAIYAQRQQRGLPVLDRWEREGKAP